MRESIELLEYLCKIYHTQAKNASYLGITVEFWLVKKKRKQRWLEEYMETI